MITLDSLWMYKLLPSYRVTPDFITHFTSPNSKAVTAEALTVIFAFYMAL